MGFSVCTSFLSTVWRLPSIFSGDYNLRSLQARLDFLEGFSLCSCFLSFILKVNLVNLFWFCCPLPIPPPRIYSAEEQTEPGAECQAAATEGVFEQAQLGGGSHG